MRAAFFLLFLGLICCSATPADTCLEFKLTYGGSHQGSVYLKERSATGQGVWSRWFDSVASALGFIGGPYAGELTCYRGNDSDMNATVTAWIDVSHSSDPSCENDPTPASCAPQPGDPVGRLDFVIRAHADNRVTIEIRDQ